MSAPVRRRMEHWFSSPALFAGWRGPYGWATRHAGRSGFPLKAVHEAVQQLAVAPTHMTEFEGDPDVRNTAPDRGDNPNRFEAHFHSQATHRTRFDFARGANQKAPRAEIDQVGGKAQPWVDKAHRNFARCGNPFCSSLVHNPAVTRLSSREKVSRPDYRLFGERPSAFERFRDFLGAVWAKGLLGHASLKTDLKSGQPDAE